MDDEPEEGGEDDEGVEDDLDLTLEDLEDAAGNDIFNWMKIQMNLNWKKNKQGRQACRSQGFCFTRGGRLRDRGRLAKIQKFHGSSNTLIRPHGSTAH